MIALDTNILARFLLRDDVAQSETAARLLESGREFTAPPTVILELVWVLTGKGFTRSDTSRALRSLLGLPSFSCAYARELLAAIRLHELGLDFADAFHLSLSDDCEGFMTFEVRFAKRATSLDAAPSVALA